MSFNKGYNILPHLGCTPYNAVISLYAFVHGHRRSHEIASSHSVTLCLCLSPASFGNTSTSLSTHPPRDKAEIAFARQQSSSNSHVILHSCLTHHFIVICHRFLLAYLAVPFLVFGCLRIVCPVKYGKDRYTKTLKGSPCFTATPPTI